MSGIINAYEACSLAAKRKISIDECKLEKKMNIYNTMIVNAISEGKFRISFTTPPNLWDNGDRVEFIKYFEKNDFIVSISYNDILSVYNGIVSWDINPISKFISKLDKKKYNIILNGVVTYIFITSEIDEYNIYLYIFIYFIIYRTF